MRNDQFLLAAAVVAVFWMLASNLWADALDAVENNDNTSRDCSGFDRRSHVRSLGAKRRRFRDRVRLGVLDWNGNIVLKRQLGLSAACVAGVPPIVVTSPLDVESLTAAPVADSDSGTFCFSSATFDRNKVTALAWATRAQREVSLLLSFPVHNLGLVYRAVRHVVGGDSAACLRALARLSNFARHRPLANFPDAEGCVFLVSCSGAPSEAGRLVR